MLTHTSFEVKCSALICIKTIISENKKQIQEVLNLELIENLNQVFQLNNDKLSLLTL